MKLIRESVTLFTLLGELDSSHQLSIAEYIESCGRECYKSTHKISDGSSVKFVENNAIRLGHESMLEHLAVTAKLVTNRGVTHELVRHRVGNYSQESTRYCNYSSDRFGNELTFIIPEWVSDDHITILDDIYTYGLSKYSDEVFLSNIDNIRASEIWYNTMLEVEDRYLSLLQLGWTPEKAREVLPNSLATTIVVTYNLRQWRHVINQRLSPQCHPQMRSVMRIIYKQFIKSLPLFFSDIVVSE